VIIVVAGMPRSCQTAGTEAVTRGSDPAMDTATRDRDRLRPLLVLAVAVVVGLARG
jgi:hypothetical protein